MKFGLRVIALSFLAAPALAAAQLAPALSGDHHKAAVEFLASIPWPDAGAGRGFKWLVIGNDFDLDDPSVTTHLEEGRHISREAPGAIVCSIGNPYISASCNVYIGSATFDGLPEAHQQLYTALGEIVSVRFELFLHRPLTQDFVDANFFGKGPFGSGRIVSIYVTNEQPSSDFVSKAVAYFSSQAGRPPAISIDNQAAKPVSTPECDEIVARMATAKQADISEQDVVARKRCDAQTLMSYLGGSGVSKKVVAYDWPAAEGDVEVKIVAANASVLDGLVSAKSASLQMSLNYSEASSIAKRRFAELRASDAAAKESKAATDF